MHMHYEVTVDIEAGADAVWSALADVESWPRWTASVTSVRRLDQGELRVGSEARVEQPRLRPATWRVTDLEPGTSFVWETQAPGLLSIGGHFITRLEDGRSRVVLTVDQVGFLAPLLRPFVDGLVRGYVSMEGNGLKSLCEGNGDGRADV